VPIVNAFLTDPQKPYWVALDLDWRVLAATAVVMLLVGIVAGLLPALRTTRFGNATSLRDGGHASTAATLGRTTQILTVSQLLLSTGVLVVALVLGRGVFEAGMDCYPGDASRVLVGATAFQRTTPNALGTARAQLLTRAAALPGVQAAALTTRDPDTRGMPSPVEIRDHTAAAGAAQVPVEWITPGYFTIFGVQPVRGRLFGESDRESGPPIAVVNESFARRFWPGEDPIGKLCQIEDAESEPQWRTVVGVVPDLPVAGIARGRHEPGVYLPLHESSARRVNLLLRTAGSPLAYSTSVQQLLGEVAPDQPFQSLLTLDKLIAQRLRLPRLMTALAFAFGITGGVLAAVGVFGVTAFFVEQRWRELGVRVALGATPRQIGALVIGRGVWQLAIGLAGGLALGIALMKPVQAIPVFQTIAAMHATDLAAVSGLMVVTVLLACWLPARRATKVNPVEALRAE
jgi:predicted permease